MASRTDLSNLHDRLSDLRRSLLRRRRSIAVVFVVIAVFAGLRTVDPPQPETVDVLVADRDLPAGAVLAAEDLRTVDLPAESAPEGVVADPAGATLAGPVARGEPITTTRITGAALTTAEPGFTATPVRLGDAAQAALLRVGDRIDLLATDPQASTTKKVATGVAVLALPSPAGTNIGGTLTGRIVVLGLPHGLVDEVTRATVVSFVTFAWSTG